MCMRSMIQDSYADYSSQNTLAVKKNCSTAVTTDTESLFSGCDKKIVIVILMAFQLYKRDALLP